jgi:hypothetical protein
MLSEAEQTSLSKACAALSPLLPIRCCPLDQPDFVKILMDTVLETSEWESDRFDIEHSLHMPEDFFARERSTKERRAAAYFQDHFRTKARTSFDLAKILTRAPNDRDLAQHLWNISYLNYSAERLRKLASYFEHAGINSIVDLRAWGARTLAGDFEAPTGLPIPQHIEDNAAIDARLHMLKTNPDANFRLVVHELIPPLLMRLDVEILKPNTHLQGFVKQALNNPGSAYRYMSDVEMLEGIETAAAQCQITARKLDWRIWRDPRLW